MEQLSTTMNHLVAQGTPLSSGQMRLWFLDQLDLVDSAYNSIHEIDFGCRIDPETLRMAIRQIIQRHEVLRTYFQVVGDRVVQVISPSFEAELPVLDLHDLPSAERAGRVKAEISELCRRPFDLRQLPLFRTLLVRPGPDKDILLLQLHHIIADGQSSLVLLKELSAIYHAGRLGMPSAGAPRLPVQYSDYALWEQEWLLSKASTKQLSYWREQLKDPPPPLELPADELHVESPNAGVVSFELPEPMVLELKRLARQEKVTLFMFLLAAFQCLLYRYTGGPDIIIGSPVAGRIRPEFENLIGFFVNTVALRTRIAGEETFRDLLTRVRAICLRAYGNQEFPFDRIVEELHPDRRLDSTPIFQVMLSLNRISKAPMEGTTWSFRSLATEDQRPQFDLLLAFFETESEVAGTLTYRSSIFRRATMDRLVGHFQEFIRQVSANVETSIDAVQILTEDERRRLLYDLNATESIYPGGKCLHELFEDQVERAPQATALVSGTQRIDYRELNQKAGRLASYLQCLGVGPEVRVGICLKRSPEIIVSILAVLKAGGAYVPLDPAYPAERLAFMASDSGLKVLIAGGMIPKSLSEQVSRNGSRIVVIDDESTWSSESLPSLHVAGKAVPSNLAYIIYTSGSTGVPKGVSIEHRNAVNFIRWALSVFSPEDLAHTVASTSVCFDLSIFEIFAPLSCGGEILLVENALQLKAEIGELQVSLINTVPSVMQELLYMGSLPSLRTLNLAGEPFTGALLQRIREANLTTRIFNLYGPSETTTYSSFARAGNNVNRAVPIGRPVGNTQCYVLDRLIEPVPVGVAGELYIGGQGVSRGYLGRPELTAERFIPDPFAKEAGRRLYKTGDLVRYRMTGDLEFVGRIDHQVKIRGFRIELGEIEAALLEHASVREAIVVARQERDGDKRLVAYVVREQREEEESEKMVDDGLEAATETLRRYLNRKLPSHMIPGRLVFLKSLPLTPNGKVDRDRLPEPEISCAGNARLYLAPRTSTEQTIADIWSELLSGQQISVDQSFFELGGHSLLAARAVLRMREVFGIEIPFRLIFEHPDVAGLARQFSAGLGSAFQSVPLERQGREGRGAGEEFVGCYVFGASYGQQRLWFLHELNELSGVAYHVCGGLKLEGAVSREQMAEGLNRVVARHESLRTRLALVEGELSQIIEPELRLEMGYEDIRSRGAKGEEERLGEIRAEVAERRFDLRTGPLVRASLVRVEEEVYQLMMAAHHIICDGWSVNVFIGDLMEEYRGLVEGDGGKLEELKLQYADFAVWQRKWLESGEAEWEMEYWKEKLGGEAPLVNLPLDGVRPVMQSFRGGTEEVVLGREMGERLRGQGRAAGATMYMTLLSGFKVLLHKYGQGDIWVGTPVANRLGRELEGVVGFFVNTLVMRTKLESELRFGEVLERVRETVAGGYGHQQLPFEKLVQELHPQRQLSTTPLFQVMFAVEEEAGMKTGPCGLNITPVMMENGTAKFDLTLFMAERAEGLVARLEYNRDLFEGSTIRRMLGHLGGLLEKIGREPERRLCELSLLTEGERRQIVEEWNATEAEYPEGRQLQELFEEQAGRAPEAIAVVCEGQRVSYRELNERANQLGHYLREQGVGAEVRVGICVERSVEMVVGQLGILKAGGAYVPMDAEYPGERLQYMIADMGGAWVLTQERLQERVAGAAGVRMLCLDRDWAEIGERPVTNLGRVGSADNLAYVIYTSGSTGQPKGVMVSHRNLNNLVQWHGQAFGVGRDDRGSCVAGLGFDASVWEVWPYLVAGASLALPREEERRDAEQLQRWIIEAGVSVAFVPTVLAEQLLLQSWPPGGALRVLLTGGDRLSRRQGEKLAFKFSNNYGPTEATVVATSGWVESEGEQPPSIGRPIGNTRVYVLDAQLQPVPVGIAGELYISGQGVSRGYLGRPELTAERFIPDPFAREAGQRLYKTGDLVRYRVNGELEFVGRADHQVKIRGFRIELGEIEAVLQEQAGVREAVVTVQVGESGEQQLVAYVVTEGASGQAGLRDALRRKLPEYMVPGAYVFLERLPLTANGKVDRDALPRAEMWSTEGAEYEAPRTLAEKRMAGIWEELLGVERVGIRDNFFDLGGHSLQATKVILRMREALQTPIAISELFHHPTIAGLAEKLLQDGGASPALSELPLERQRREGRGAGEEFGGCYVFGASYGQQRLWFLHELNELSGVAYHVCGGLKLEGAVSREQMAEGLNRVVARHESLRTRLALVEGELSQIIEPELRLEMGYEDVRGRGAKGEEERLGEIRAEVAERRFDLRTGPLVRASLVRVEEEVYQLMMAAHHIICDGWSVNVFIGDLMEEYRGLVEGDGGKLEELKLQYADFAVWQRKWLESGEAEWEMEYWKEKLGGEAPLVNLPLDGVRPVMQSFRGGTEEVVLGREMGERLRGQGRAAGATMYMTLLSGFKVLLHKYGQGDIWVGTPVANRLGRELEGVVGFFVNTLVMRTKLESELRFGEVLERVRETVAGGYGHQQLPFEKLVQELHPQRQLSTTPLFQVMFAVEEEAGMKTGPCGLNITPVMMENGTAKFDLTLFMAERAEGLVARLEYNRDLFEGSTIRRMLGHLGGLLEKIGREPERRLCELSLLTEEERRQIVEEWNATEAEYPQRCLQELFEEQAGRAPEAIAVAHGARQWSYGELNRRANRLAHYLQQRGVGPEMRVGIFMQRSLEMIAGLLGVLKAGGAYVPLDPGYPRERLEWMLEDGQVEVLLSEERLQEQCRGRGTQLICMEQEWEQIERQSDQNPVKRTDVQNLAYVIYTSGSTGRPKGVAVTHHSANVMVHWAREVFTDEELAGVLASTSICFDLSIFEIFVPLSWGGKVLLAENALELAAMVGAEQVRLINTVPSAIVELLRMKAVPSSVRTVNLAGEALQRNLVEQVYAMEQIERVLNLYGPSEDTTYSTYEWVKAGAGGEAVSIGRPIANTKVYVLDAALEAVPVGVAGELCIGGEGQARGYLNRAELTAECFVPDPHSRRGGQRMYRTGDLARWKAEGSLEFLGRIDHQVKIRGYRIEMGEIESGLMQQDGIDQAVVVVHGSAADQRLVAYVVAQDGATELNIGALRENLRKKVPGYMVPETIVQLAELPLTFNGKVDRKKLPEPERDRDQSADYVGPRNAEEEILCGIFAEVLKLESVGTEDDFFQMGGHSLLATQVVSRIRSTFGVELPLRDLFEAPTVASVAERIKVARGVSRNGAPPLVAMKREGVVPLSYGQHRLWFIDQLEPGNPAYNIAFGVRLKGELEREGLCWSLNEIVRRHESLRTSFPLRDGNPVQEITAASVLLVEEVNLPGEPEEDCQTRVLAEARREAGLPFDLGRGPLLRVKLLRVEEQDHVLLVTMHHIVSDGWSISVMMREFMQLYQAWLKKEESSLPELKVQYADYTLWQREWLRGEVLERELAYWREQLADVPVLELPVDNPRPALMSYRGDTVKVVFSTELTESLKQLSRRQGVTLFMSMLAVFQMVLGRYAGQEDVAVGTGIANRNRRETEGLIGFFVNTLVLRTQLSGNLSFIDLLKRVQQVTLAAYQHQDMPFEKLVDGLHPERDLSRTPLFQAMLMFQNLRMPELQLPGLRVSEFNIEAEVAKFDVMLTLQENGGTLNGELSYARDLYEAATMERLVGHVAEVLKRMVERPDVWIGEVSLLTHTERRQIVEEWNATATEYPQGCQLQELIEQQVERSPEALAVIYEGQRLSYRELNERANQLGCYLREQGVGSDVRVAICLERSVEMVVGLLGIMKAAGAYVPLDPDYPEERLKYMLADTQPTLLLTQERMQARLAGLGSVRALCLDRDWAAIAERPVTNLRRIGSVDDLAYVIYTSGSTGQPKGAMIPHRGIVNRLIWMQEQYQLTGEDRVLQKTPFSFDVSVWEFFWPLLTGAGLVVCQPGRHGDSRYLVELIEKERVTTLHFVPSMLSQFLEDPEVEKCVSLRQVICSGEALPATVQEHFFTRMNAELHNLYGPTEASVDVTYWKCLRGEGDRAVPIGRPIANTQMYVLDQHLNALPVGVKGDLYIGGVGLGRGYQNRPELTADKFIPDSLGTEAGQRLYKTGDLARYRADGSLGFLGRGDFQVKVRGFRIELGEIEGALQSHEGIREAVVVARKSREGDHRLVAYLVASGESAPGINELRSYLLERLPSYMVPAQFITLAQMPLGKNGKVDRKALPEAGKERPEIEEQYVEASTAEEKVLAEVWRQVLGVERVGVHDNFFTLGGDSIRSLQVITKARAQRLQITLQQLFRTPTIHGLAAHSQWSAEPVAPAEQPRPFDLIADNDRAKLQALLSRKNSSRQIDEKEICPA